MSFWSSVFLEVTVMRGSVGQSSGQGLLAEDSLILGSIFSRHPFRSGRRWFGPTLGGLQVPEPS